MNEDSRLYKILRLMGLQLVKSTEEKIAVAKFKSEFRDEHVTWSLIVEKKTMGKIIGIAYGFTKPPSYKFYYVDEKLNAKVIEDYIPPTGFWPSFTPNKGRLKKP